MSVRFVRDDVRGLSAADLAAFGARKAWLEQARNPKRGGKQIPPDDLDWEVMLYIAGRGFGKLLDVDTPIPTPAGWTTMGELRPGARVFDEAGRVCNVTWVSAEQTPLSAFRLTFSDGSELDACAEHQWVTWTHAERKAFLRSPYEDARRFPENWPAWRVRRHVGGAKKGPVVYPGSPGPRIRTTADIAATMTYGGRGDLNHCIPQCGTLDLPHADLPIPPYTLGAWLGDGSSRDGSFYAHEDDMAFLREQIALDGFASVQRRDTQAMGSHGLYRRLRLAGLLRNKHVPTIYLRASAAQRLALLQGLFDTDGGNDNASLVSFTGTNKALVDAVAELAVSLGQKVRRDDRLPVCGNNGKVCDRAYRVAFTPTIQVFRLPRKAAKISFDDGQALRRHHRMIVSAAPIPSRAMRCITVDSPNSMYLAGRSMIPTHNTRTLNEAAWWEAWRVPNLVVHAVAPTLSDVRGTTFEGPAGFNKLIPAECLLRGTLEKAYNKSTHELRLANNSLIRGFGAVEEAGRLRGPQCHFLVGDELREWDRPAGNLETAISNALFGLRLPYPDGTPARALFGTTPKPIPYLKRFMRREKLLVMKGTSYENLDNLSATYRTQLMSMAGTAIGRQEIDGLFLDEDGDQTIIRRNWIKLWPHGKKLPVFNFVIESYDTASSEHNYDKKKQTTDPTGCAIFGVFNVADNFSPEERKKMGLGRGRYAALLLDCWDERLGLPDLLEKARLQHRTKWGTPGRRSDIVLIEDKSSGPGLRQFLAEYSVPCFPYNPGRQDKTMRLHAISPLLKQGCLFVPESGRPDLAGQPRDWAEPYLEQLCAFSGPGSVEHDEFIDVTSSAFAYLHDRHILEAPPQERHVDFEMKLAEDREEALAVSQRERRRNVGAWYG